jgi:ketosteroid isomerase-like protein
MMDEEVQDQEETMKAKTVSRYSAMAEAMAVALAIVCFVPSVAVAAPDDEAAIRALEDRFAAAVSAGDVNAIMKSYVPDQSLVVFDVVPPRQYLGADAYRKDWVNFLAFFKGAPKLEVTDLAVTVEGNLGFSHSIQRVSGMDANGQPIDLTARVTDGYRKIGGDWLIVHEHVSVPVDLATGKADLSSKP